MTSCLLLVHAVVPYGQRAYPGGRERSTTAVVLSLLTIFAPSSNLHEHRLALMDVIFVAATQKKKLEPRAPRLSVPIEANQETADLISPMLALTVF